MKNSKRFFALVFAAVLAAIFTYSPIVVHAENYQIYGSFQVSCSNHSTGVELVGTELRIKEAGDYIIKSDYTPQNINITAPSGKVNITFAGVNVDVSGQGYKSAFGISGNCETVITLADGSDNQFRSGFQRAGINNDDHPLTIQCVHHDEEGHVCDDSCGKLEAIGGNGGAGIGSGYGVSAKNINILGGNIAATGRGGGAGIGGGFDSTADNINISGGNITASGYNGAGIGGGNAGDGKNISISGGNVTAGSMGGAGIGGGYANSTSYGHGSGISISGGTVKARSLNGTYWGGAGIGGGGGNTRYGTDISISGGTVEATGTEGGAGIGGGRGGFGTNIRISGGDVTAKSNDNGAGIGGGDGSKGENIKISGGKIKAVGGPSGGGGAGIGGGYRGPGIDIGISAGDVTATGGYGGAGIGGSYNGHGERISISGGEVVATGGRYAAGIGGGYHELGMDITISGGHIIATGSVGGAGIGGGSSEMQEMSASGIYISGGTVIAKHDALGVGIGAGVSEYADSNYDGVCNDIRVTGGSVNARIPHALSGSDEIQMHVYTFKDGAQPQADMAVSGLKDASANPLKDYENNAYGETDIKTDADGKIYLWHTKADNLTGNRASLATFDWEADSAGNMSKILPKYAVTLPSGTGYTVAATSDSTSPVVEGGSYSFTVTIGSGYKKGADFAVKANGAVLPEANGKYTIDDIQEIQDVTVVGVEQETAPTQPESTTTPAAGATTTAAAGSQYSYRQLSDTPSGIRVSGEFTADALLSVEDADLHAEGSCAVCDLIRTKQRNGEVIILFDISLSSGGYQGELTINFPVAAEYEGKTITILHCHNKQLEQREAKVTNGYATAKFSSMSPFALVKGAGGNQLPSTGEHSTTSTIGGIVVALSSLALLAFLQFRRRRRYE